MNVEARPGATIAALFDAWAPTYDTGRLSRWYQAQGALALDRLQLPQGGTVLDIGCGTGWALRRLAEQRPDITGLGVDLSGVMISTARAAAQNEGLRNLCFHHIDWEGAQSTLAESYDAVLCISAFHYFSHPAQALGRMRSVLRPGGSLLLVERAMEGSLLTWAWDVVHRRLIRDGVAFASSRTLRALMEDAGFVEVRNLARINRLFWKNKLYTSLVLIEARAPGGG